MGFSGWMGRGLRLQVGISSTCLLSFILYGYDQGVFSGILQDEDWKRQFDFPDAVRTGIIVSSYTLGCIGGCAVNVFVAENIGRRKLIFFSMILIIIGAIIQASSFHQAQLFVGRVVTGFGTGIETSTVPSYQSELCAPRLRGRLVSAELLFVAVGIAFAYWFDYGMSFADGSISWRLPIAFQIVFAAIVMVLLLDLPESPRFLVKRNRHEDATQVLCRFFDEPESSESVMTERQSILDAIAIDAGEGVTWMSLLKNDNVKTRRRTLLAFAVMSLDQATGINLVVFYIPSALTINVGMGASQAQIISGCVQIVFMLASLLPSFALDRMGRRKTLLTGLIGIGFSMMMIAILLSFDGNPKVASASVAFFFLYEFIFGMTINCAPWVYAPEILPLHVRLRAATLANGVQWIWNFFVVMISPVLIDNLGGKAYLIFMAIAYAFVPIVYFFFPETSGLSLEGIDYLFLEGGPASTPFVKAAGKSNVQNNPSMNLESFTDKKAIEVEETRVERAPAA
ncbi:hypothetical protein MMC08_000358 [Hypocenomyce scalaris]|nr:hypothetical protein [Hypocenomyce scalaris]